MKRSPSFGYISGMVRRDHEENPEVSYEQDHARFYGKYNQDHGAIAIKPAGERVDSLCILMDQEAEPDAPPRRSQKKPAP